MMFLILFISLLFFLFSLKRFEFVLYLFIIVLPSYLIRFDILGVPTTALELFFLALFISFIIQYFFIQKQTFQSLAKTPYLPPILLLWTAGIIGVFISPETMKAIGLLKAYIFEPTLFYFIFISTIQTKRQLKSIVWSLGILGSWIGLFAIIQSFTGYPDVQPYISETPARMTSVFPYPNAMSLLLAPILVLFSTILIKVRFFRKKTIWWGIEIITLIGIGVLLSISEGAWIAVLVALFICGLTTSYRLKLLSIAALGIIIAFAIPDTRDYIITLLTFQDTSGDVRLVLWQGTWNLLKNNSIFGAGLSGFPILYPDYKLDQHIEFLQYPHNMILNWWSELGLLGLFSLFWIMILFFKQAFAQIKKKYDDILSSWPLIFVMTSILIYGLIDVPYFKNDLAFVFWIFIGMMTIITSPKLKK